ncbi:MAG: hypothetical protein RH946_00815 [Rhodospirillales bacterium]
MNVSIHPSAIKWSKALPNDFGPVTGSESRIGSVYMLPSGWHCTVADETFGPFNTERKAQKAAEKFYISGFADRPKVRSAA